MKVLFLTRATLYSNPGGDTVQITKTAEWLGKSGVETDIRLTNEKIDYHSYDLIHYFNIIRPSDILHHVNCSSKPYVVSTIFVDYSEYEKKAAKGFRGLLFRFVSSDVIEYCKAIARYFFNKEKVIPYYLLHGHTRSVKKVIQGASLLLPNSENEYRRLVNRYQIEKPYRIIPNGIDTSIFAGSAPLAIQRQNDMVLCVARIEPLKNQLNLIRAVNNTSLRLTIVGRPSVNHARYYEECKKAAGEAITFVDFIAQEQLLSYYAIAKVHVLPSWFETTGLSSLEAGAMGCNIVITDKGDAKEYFRDLAYYCDPASVASIREAILKAASDSVDDRLRALILEKYTWYNAANETRSAYNHVTHGSDQ